MTAEEMCRRLHNIDEFVKALDLFPWGEDDEDEEEAE